MPAGGNRAAPAAEPGVPAAPMEGVKAGSRSPQTVGVKQEEEEEQFPTGPVADKHAAEAPAAGPAATPPLAVAASEEAGAAQAAEAMAVDAPTQKLEGAEEEQPAEPAAGQGAAEGGATAEEDGMVVETAEGQGEAEEAGAAEDGAASAFKKQERKSVRFNVEGAEQRGFGTPEGAARDATITIRLRKGDIEQARAARALRGPASRPAGHRLSLGQLPADQQPHC